jgi:hypothetical protein
VAAWFPDTFCNFYSLKNCKIAKNSTTTKAAEKITSFGIFRTIEIFDVHLTELKNNPILFNKIICNLSSKMMFLVLDQVYY